ncbi:hypothetical protein JCM1840_004585 [Sporobolomyces johnsonii]
MATASTTKAALDASLKSTLLQLSKILSFQAQLQQHGAAQYATHAPSQLTAHLKAEVERFDAVCAAVEQRVLRAIAVLERDARKAAGISPLPAPSPSSVVPPPPPADSSLFSTEPAAPPALPAQTEAPPPIPPASSATANLPMELDLTLSPSPPPAAEPAPPATEPLPFALPTTSTSTTGVAAAPLPSEDLNALLSSLNMPPFDASLSSLPSSSTSATPSVSQSAAEAMAALLGSAPPLLDTSTTTGAPSIPPADSGGGGGGDFNLTGFDFASIGLPTTTATATSHLDGVVGPGSSQQQVDPSAGATIDLTGMGMGDLDLSQLGEPNLDELLKSLGGS